MSPTTPHDTAVPAPPSMGLDAVARSGSPYGLAARWADYQALVKPRITRLVVITAALGFFLAVRDGYAWTWLMLGGTLFGTALSCMAASVFNQALERRTDALMPRTANRPLAAERLPLAEALALGFAFMLAGQAMLCMFGTPLASAVAGFTIVSYVLMYTPLKRVSPTALYVGAIPGALPPVIGYAAVSGDLGSAGAAAVWLMFLVMAVWQVPHFLAIGYMYRKDYAAGGLAMHAVRDPSGRSSMRGAVVSCGVLLVLGALPTLLGHAGWVAFGVVAAAGLGYLFYALRWAQRGGRDAARRLFFVSLIYLPVVLAVLLADAK
ncbi:MAG: heme o synthase [Planctomycetota bacterium]